MNIKLVIISVILSSCLGITAFAQTDSKDRLYLSFSVGSGSAPAANLMADSFENRFIGLQLGVRFSRRISVFLTDSAELYLTNKSGSKTYNELLALGGGVSVTFPVGKYFSLEPVLSCSSTIMKRERNCLIPKLELRLCGQSPAVPPVFMGIGLQYIHPYSKEAGPNIWLPFLSLGFQLF